MDRMTTFFVAIVALLQLVTVVIDAAGNDIRLMRYATNTTIANRFARTSILLDFVNEGNCSSLYGLTLQLPRNARVTSLTMDLSDGCTVTRGTVVQREAQAQEQFAALAQQGRPAAILQAHDLENYQMQVWIPPLGAARVEVSLRQLLQRQRGRIDFSIPLFPGLPVEELVMDVSIKEPGGISTFGLVDDDESEDSGYTTTLLEQFWNHGGTTTFTARLFNVPEDGRLSENVVLPRLLRGYYDPGPLPEEGLLIADSTTGTCFVHLFNPPSLSTTTSSSLPRTIVFALDVSGSMEGQKLTDVKVAFETILDKLTDQDWFAIHSFSNKGIMGFFGPNPANSQSKESAKAWVQQLQAYGSTNLGKAYTDAIQRVQEMQVVVNNATTATTPIVMVLSDGQASKGIIDSVEISRSIQRAQAKEFVDAKIYSLAFGEGADFPLLTAISLQNQGLAIRIYEGFGDASEQMEHFFEAELGTILATNVNVFFIGDVKIDSQTQTRFPVFPEGSEIAVRGITREDSRIGEDSTLKATTIASTAKGQQTWEPDVVVAGNQNTLVDYTHSDCFQSFAHAKIGDLLRFREAASALGTELDKHAAQYLMQNAISWWDTDANSNLGRGSVGKQHGNGRRRSQQQWGEDLDLVGAAEIQAVRLAVEAGVVWPGLTAMVTAYQSPSCATFSNNNRAEMCFDGDAIEGRAAPTSPPVDGTFPPLQSAAWSFVSFGTWWCTFVSSFLLAWIL